MCLLACLSQNIPVPEFNYPLYNAAMLGLVVTCSGLDKSQKVSDVDSRPLVVTLYSQERMKLLVERMAGIYSSSFHDGVTHLVTVKVCALHWFVIAGLHVSPCFRL